MVVALVMIGGKCSTKTSDHLFLFSQEQMEKAVHWKPVHEENNLTSAQSSSQSKHFSSRWLTSGNRLEWRLCCLFQTASGQLTDGIIAKIDISYQVTLSNIKFGVLVSWSGNEGPDRR